MFLTFSFTPRQRSALFKIHFPRGSTAVAAGLSREVGGWPGAGRDLLCMAGYGSSLTLQGLPCTASTWASAPGQHCPLSALPVGPGSFPQLPPRYAEKAAEICSVLLIRGHLEFKPSTFGVPDLTLLLPNHLRGPGCPGTLWLVVQRSLFSGREPGFLQDFKTDYPVSLLTLVLFPYVFWVFFSGGNPAVREQFFDAIKHGSP